MANELTLKSFFLCRNIVGLWLLQQARATWQRSGKEYSYTDIVRLSEEAPEGGPLIYPDDPSFLAPEDMVVAIGNYCKRTGQKLPHGPAETARCILESLSLCYRHNLEKLSEVLERRFSTLHIVGGGTLNTLLCRFTADATGLPVLAGPVEATVAGNVLVQALSRGFLTSPQEIRDIVRGSFELVEYEPRDTTKWEDRYGQYMRLVEREGVT
jgi:rhamnulokinase